MRKRILALLLPVMLCLLSGCAIRTVEQMYCLPKRPESYNDLQSVMDAAMEGMDYSAPRSGENQQTVQMADLDGDGVREYLLFARSTGEKTLHILIFTQQADSYSLIDTLSCSGASFDVVEYVQMDGIGGMELVVGCQLSEQVPRSVGVYTFRHNQLQQLLAANYTKFLTPDLDNDGLRELMVLRPGTPDAENGIAELYGVSGGVVWRSNEARMSAPAERLKRIIVGGLHGGKPGVFVATTADENAIITDVYTLTDGVFTNVSLSNESGTSVQTLRNYYLYADDIDDDGEVELPSLITMKPLQSGRSGAEQYLIRWYTMGEDGSETDKMYTYHNYAGGWYLQLQPDWTRRVSVEQNGSEYGFYLWDAEYIAAEKIFSVYVLTGQNREEQAVLDNRFVIQRSENVIYAARLEVASGALRLTQDDLINCFRLIRQDWNTGEM